MYYIISKCLVFLHLRERDVQATNREFTALCLEKEEKAIEEEQWSAGA
ncbi:hypothetical protein EYF80_067280 [Liparis tanakae]|uniref:Uncharacterized protein n=1 Tax=Liparis tanakae TaxID=230148 RepID=A0A4Z2E179_9TELE|nr:hypothetical protein EYF80_067280 [Liparis tanakae]